MATKTRPRVERKGGRTKKGAIKRGIARRAPRTADARLESKLTARLQTTMPSGVRKALGLAPGDRVEYTIHGEQAVIRRAAIGEEDPALGKFLELLAEDMASSTAHIRSIPAALLERMRAVTTGVPIDHDTDIDGAIEI